MTSKRINFTFCLTPYQILFQCISCRALYPLLDALMMTVTIPLRELLKPQRAPKLSAVFVVVGPAVAFADLGVRRVE